MIVQHTSKECKTKFSIGVEFKNSFNTLYILCLDELLFYILCGKLVATKIDNK